LDRLIAKIQLLGDSVPSEFERTLRIEYSQGKVDLDAMNRILEAHRREVEGES
jgi:hypothetical protein